MTDRERNLIFEFCERMISEKEQAYRRSLAMVQNPALVTLPGDYSDAARDLARLQAAQDFVAGMHDVLWLLDITL